MRRVMSLVLVCLLLSQVVFALAASEDSWACPKCETVNAGKFCTECGEKKPSACPSCKEPLPEGHSFKFCPSCGESLTEAPAAEAAAATAEAPTGPLHLMQVHQDTYVRTLFLTKESYPEMMLRPGYASTQIPKFQEGSLPYVHIPNPADAVPIRFDYSSCAFINEDKRIVYNYEMYDRYAYEDFNAKVSDEQVLRDGSDGVAIQVRPDVKRAEALIAVPQLGKTAKVWIAVNDGKISSRQSEKEVFDILAEKITAEVERVKSGLQVKPHAQHWTTGRYASFTMKHFDSSHDHYVLTHPDLIVTEVDDLKLEGMFYAGKDQFGSPRFHELEIELREHPSSEYWEPSSSTRIIRHSLKNGLDAITNLHVSDGKVLSSRTQLVFGTGLSYGGEITLYMEIYYSYAFGFQPATDAQVQAKLDDLFSHLAIHHAQ